MKFEKLDLPPEVIEGIKTAGFRECTPVQELILPEALRGRDVAVQSQTGTGKTAAFLITLFSRMLSMPRQDRGSSPRALIIAPTRELVVQIDAEARLLGGHTGFSTVPVYGGIDYHKQREDLSKGVDILIGTPGRLIDYLKQNVYNLKKTQFLVIDEADRMFDMGFISDLRFILRRMSPYNKRQSMLFSATLSHRVLELCYEYMNAPERFEVTPEQVTVERVEQELYHVGEEEKFGLLLGILRREAGGRYLIFCNMRAVAERVGNFLTANGLGATAITGDLPQQKRLKVLTGFKSGAFPILVATDVAGRGLHIDGVTHVINFDLPQDPEDYVHRIGRTARAGSGGKAISFACEDYVYSLPDIEEYIRQKIPVAELTDEMIVTDYRKAPARHEKRGPKPHERRPERGQMHGKRRGPADRGGIKEKRPGPQVTVPPEDKSQQQEKPAKKRRRRRPKKIPAEGQPDGKAQTERGSEVQ